MSKLNYRKVSDITGKILSTLTTGENEITEQLFIEEVNSLSEKEKKLLILMINEKIRNHRGEDSMLWKDIADSINAIFGAIREIKEDNKQSCKDFNNALAEIKKDIKDIKKRAFKDSNGDN